MQDPDEQISNKAFSIEREQALVRLINCSVILSYVTICYFYDLLGTTVLILYLLAIPFSLSMLLWVTAKPEENHLRRIIGMFADLGTTTAAMSLSGAAASPLFLFYLWITFGNGVRFGEK